VAYRANGTGSIGIERYLVLIAGKGNNDGCYLLDVKESLPPSALSYLKLKQPKWKNEADRAISIQRRVEAAPPAFLSYLKLNNKWFTLRELQPMDDKIDFRLLHKDMERFTHLVTDMALIVAWNNLRSGGRQGSAIADELIKFGKRMPKLENEIIDYAEKYAATTIKYWKAFKHEYERS
jgi:uncharacterized protein (DUF2252 family)